MKEKRIRCMRQLKIELGKALKNRMFLITLGIGTGLALLAALYQISYYNQTQAQESSAVINPMIEENTLYNHWMGGEMQSFGAICFFYVLPLLAAIPYGWSYFVEKRSGYTKYLMIKGGKREYFICKYVAVFCSGGLVILLPLILNFILVAMFVPAILPEAHYTMYYGVDYGTMWSVVFYKWPLLYDILYMLLDFVFAGLFACMSLSCAVFLKNRIAITIVPYFVIMVLHYSRTFCYYKFFREISPLNFLAAGSVENVTAWWIVLLEGVVFFLVPAILLYIADKREVL